MKLFVSIVVAAFLAAANTTTPIDSGSACALSYAFDEGLELARNNCDGDDEVSTF